MSRWICLVIICLSSCSLNVTQDQLIGVYSSRLGECEQVLTLSVNGEYSNAFDCSGQLEWMERGTWGIDEDIDGKRVFFSNFRFGLLEYEAPVGYWFAVPERTWLFKTEFCYDELGHCFEAVKPRLPE